MILFVEMSSFITLFISLSPMPSSSDVPTSPVIGGITVTLVAVIALVLVASVIGNVLSHSIYRATENETEIIHSRKCMS